MCYNIEGDKMENKRWIVGVSGGCDSMALLDKLYQSGYQVIVAHVNYQKRETAYRDQEIVEHYCHERSIPFLLKLDEDEHQGNFQAYARNLRYAFFKENVKKYQCLGVMIAHQSDDVIETYLLQKQRKSIPIIYGLQEEVRINGLLIKRPLLSMSKKQCREYCEEHHIKYGEDESNHGDDYARNRVRHHIVEKLSDEERNNYFEEIKLKNNEKKAMDLYCLNIAESYAERLSIKDFLKEDSQLQKVILRHWLRLCKAGVHFSSKMIENIIQCINQDHNWSIDLKEDWQLQRSYEALLCIKKDSAYEYKFTSIQEFNCEYFKISKSGNSLQAVTLRDEDFPICVRSPKKGDCIELRLGTKKLNRWFIDRKISHNERKIWPVLVNSMGNVILVPQIGCDIEHFSNKPSCFVIK